MSERIRPFGPFMAIPLDEIEPTSLHCYHCREYVERYCRIMPGVAPRLIVRACRCGSVITWEDSGEPNVKHWWHAVRLMRRNKVHVLIINGKPYVEPGFGGVN